LRIVRPNADDLSRRLKNGFGPVGTSVISGALVIAMKLADSLLLLEEFSDCSSSQEVGVAFTEMTARYGYTMTSCCGSRETPAGWAWDFFFNTWPNEWLHEYQRNDYVRHDLLPAMARLTSTPFTWRELLRDREQTPEQVEFHDRVRGLGVVDGYAVPIHSPGGEVGLCVSVATHPIEDKEERLALHLASFYAHSRCRALAGLAEPSSKKTPLSPREVECLKWVLEGKSDRKIAAILGISHTTVHFHVEGVKKKLGARTRSQAAAIVLNPGYL
jgi:DNA-binding CsgD family transcriptional regulator